MKISMHSLVKSPATACAQALEAEAVRLAAVRAGLLYAGDAGRRDRGAGIERRRG